jgi:desumoylating isopeptidase 1
MGQTAIDQDTFNEYLSEMREQYTADKVRERCSVVMPDPLTNSYSWQYHLLEFNCNSFTNDCIGFLTGGSIPSFIKGMLSPPLLLYPVLTSRLQIFRLTF